jgi:hypothetical protein
VSTTSRCRGPCSSRWRIITKKIFEYWKKIIIFIKYCKKIVAYGIINVNIKNNIIQIILEKKKDI